MFNKRVSTLFLSILMLAVSLLTPQSSVKASLNGWQWNGTYWNYYNNDTKLTGWVSSGGLWYFMNSGGNMMANAWVSYDGDWYYVNKDGGMESSKWITYGGKQYYLYANGAMAINTTTPDGYHVGYDGAWDGLYKTTYTPQSQNRSYTVYITESGSKYHRYGCRYLWHSCFSIDKYDAISIGYTPCSVCRP